MVVMNLQEYNLGNKFQNLMRPPSFKFPPIDFETTHERMRKLRAEHETKQLEGEKALELIRLGNLEHVSAIREDNSPLQRYNKIQNNRADFLLVKCSDSRILAVDSETDHKVYLTVSIAGNVVPKDQNTPAFKEISEMSQKVDKENGLIVDLGHCKCGALHAYGEYHKSGAPMEKLDIYLRALFSNISQTDPEKNAANQAEKAEKSISRKVGAMVFDWFKKTFEVVSTGDKKTDEKVAALAKKLTTEKIESFAPLEKLEKHKPHTTIIGADDLPFSPLTITKAKQNEVFTTSGSKNGLDELDLASIFYSIEHLGVRHLAFIAPTTDDPHELKKTDELFAKWHRDLQSAENPIIRKLTASGELTISTMHYELKSGKLEQCHFFSNKALN